MSRRSSPQEELLGRAFRRCPHEEPLRRLQTEPLGRLPGQAPGCAWPTTSVVERGAGELASGLAYRGVARCRAGKKARRRRYLAVDGKIPVSPGDEVDVALHRVTQEGKGVGRISAVGSLGQADRGGFTLFVRGGLPGERVRARVNRVARGYAEADMVAVVKESADRVRPLCPVCGACGGCQFQHGAYGWQLSVKRARVGETLERIGRFRTVLEEGEDSGREAPGNPRSSRGRAMCPPRPGWIVRSAP
ncbi:TRAM domain-containing protein [Kyrpidia spormannii]|uniref:TRAM domain-containing protein n=1 Tax=Kyrpidia spormannii TaxID=2055160 RepID=A0A6F9EH00_9BACL|nr:TRAM domain-containing protein [Kyrpidia spormannii]CAB3395760.1 protein of unknown function [Kyrpidia spormannii]